MPVRYLKIVFEFTLPIIIIVQAKKAMAFDPVAATYLAKSAASYMAANYGSSQSSSERSYNDAVDRAEEAADIGISLADLLSDLGEGDGSEEQLRNAVSKLNKTKSTIEDIHWNGSEIDRALRGDIQKGESFGKRLRGISRVIQASKAIAAIAGYRPKAAEKALKVQDIRINHLMLEELQSIKSEMYLARLENKQAKADRAVFLRELQGERGR